MNWQDYARRMHAVAHNLVAEGAEPGETLAILMENFLEWDLLEKGGFRAGLAVLGLDPGMPAEYLHHMLNDSGAHILAVRHASQLSRLNLKALPKLRMIIVAEPESTPLGMRLLPFHRLLDAETQSNLPALHRDMPAMVVYTSGTSGNPQGIVYTHAQYLLACDALAKSFPQLGKKSHFACWLPLANLFQRITNLLAVFVGGSVHIVREPRRVMDELPRINPTFLIGVPRFYEKLVDGLHARLATQPAAAQRLFAAAVEAKQEVRRLREDDESPMFIQRLRAALLDRLVLRGIRRKMFGTRIQWLLTGSAPIRPELLHAFEDLGLPLLEAYGQSENIVPLTLNVPHDYRIGSVGRPTPGNEIHLADDGEILVRGPGVFTRYVDGSGSARFTPEGFMMTGDKGEFDAEGYLTLTGRKGDIIKTSTGRRIAPRKIEEMLARHEGIDQAVVIGQGRKHLAALISLKAEADAGVVVKAALDSVNRELPEYEKIHSVLVIPPLTVESGQLTPNLKIRRQKVEEIHAEKIEALYESSDAQESSLVILHTAAA